MQVLVALLLMVSLLSTMTQAFYNSPTIRVTPRISKSELHMGGKMSKFGIFSPAVYGAKLVLGEARLNKLRGKAISLHSQAITAWCQQYGAYNLRLKLVSHPLPSVSYQAHRSDLICLLSCFLFRRSKKQKRPVMNLVFSYE